MARVRIEGGIVSLLRVQIFELEHIGKRCQDVCYIYLNFWALRPGLRILNWDSGIWISNFKLFDFRFGCRIWDLGFGSWTVRFGVSDLGISDSGLEFQTQIVRIEVSGLDL